MNWTDRIQKEMLFGLGMILLLQACGDGGRDLCAAHSCSDHGVCDVVGGKATCVCSSGYAGGGCDTCTPGFQDDDANGSCLPDCATAGLACGDHGRCGSSGGSAVCVCDVGYAGDRCDGCAEGYRGDASGSCLPDCASGKLRCSADQILASLAEKNPEIADAFARLVQVVDGLSDEEARALIDAVAMIETLDVRDHARILAALADREPAPRLDDSRMTVDGDLSDWPRAAFVSGDRTGDAAGVEMLDILEVRFLVSSEDFWFGAVLKGSCSSDLALLSYLDIDRGPEFDVEVIASTIDGAGANSIKYLVDGTQSLDLDATGIEWKCRDKTVEIKVPLAALSVYDFKPIATAWLYTYDLTSTAENPLFDVSRGVPMRSKTYSGAAGELFHLALGEPGAVKDPGTTLALALDTRMWKDVVQPQVAAVVEADALELLRYALALPAWQKAHGLPLDFSALPLEEKMMWAGRGQESVEYGTFAFSRQRELLDLARYRFDATTAQDLQSYRELFLANDFPTNDLPTLVGKVDDWFWKQLHYCTSPELMDRWCAAGSIDPQTCQWWEEDKAKGELTLGDVGGVPVNNNEGMSASFQLGYFQSHGYFKGDCGTHTTVAMAMYRAIGISASGWQYFPEDPEQDLATHNFPIYFDPARKVWTAYQLPTYVNPQTAKAGGWFFYPVRDPLDYLLRHVDPDGVFLYDSLHSFVQITYADIVSMLQNGIAEDVWHADFWKTYPDGLTVGAAAAAPTSRRWSRSAMGATTVPRETPDLFQRVNAAVRRQERGSH